MKPNVLGAGGETEWERVYRPDRRSFPRPLLPAAVLHQLVSEDKSAADTWMLPLVSFCQRTHSEGGDGAGFLSWEWGSIAVKTWKITVFLIVTKYFYCIMKQLSGQTRPRSGELGVCRSFFRAISDDKTYKLLVSFPPTVCDTPPFNLPNFCRSFLIKHVRFRLYPAENSLTVTYRALLNTDTIFWGLIC